MSINQVSDGELLSSVRGKINDTITKINSVEDGAQVNVATNLGITGAGNTRTITSSTGTNVTVPVATTSTAGLMATGDKSKLDGIAAGAQVNVATNLTYSTAATTGTVNSSTGTNATIPAATTSLAGLMTNADKTKLDGIAPGAQVNVATNLGQSRNATSYTVTSSTGSNTTLAAATTTNAGVFVASDKTKLDGIQAGAQVNVGTNLGSSGTGATRTITSSTGSNTSITYSAADLGAVPTSRSISTGSGLSGGGNLTANRTFSVDSTVIRTTGNQSMSGVKTFTTALLVTGTSKAAGRFYAGTTDPSNTTRLNYDGHLHVNQLNAVGDVNSNSDERLKENWRPVRDNFIDQLSLVKSGIYDRTDVDLTQAGVSAQSINQVLPEVVREADGGMLSVNYGNAALVAAVELAREVVALRERVLRLESKYGAN